METTNHVLTPHFILEKCATNQSFGVLQAIVLFVDTSGFTALTTQLMQHGKEGAEIIAQLLAEIFAPLIEIVYAQGGFVAGFAGDAFKAIFPTTQPEALVHALDAAWQIRSKMAALPVRNTRFGDFRFVVKVCIAEGEVQWSIWRGADAQTDAQSAAAIFAGDALDRCIALDPFAAAGDVVMSSEVYRQLCSQSISVEALDPHFRLLEWTARFDTTTAQPILTATGETEAQLAARFFTAQLLQSTVQGEFRQVTTLFVNLQTMPLDSAAQQFQRDLFDLLTQYGGYLCRIGQIGDLDRGGTLLLFWGAPIAHENDIARALGFVTDLRSLAPVPLRAGVTTSLAYAGFVGSSQREEYTCYGLHVNLAARQMVNAHWGEVLLDEATAQQAAAEFHVEGDGERQFKGFALPRSVYLLKARRATTDSSGYQSRYFGRQCELAQMQTAMQPIFAGRFAGALIIEGEAGAGKSRLVHELRETLCSVRDGTSRAPVWFDCQTDEILRQPLNPFRYWLRHYFHQTPDKPETVNKANFAARLEELTAALANLQPSAGNAESQAASLQSDLQRSQSFLGTLVDLRWEGSLYEQLEPKLRFENTLFALKTLIKAESLRQPVIVNLEDVHWLDAESMIFVEQLMHNVEEFPLAVVMTTRTAETAPLLQSHKVTVVRLEGLGYDEINGVAIAQLGGTVAPALIDLLCERAEGNPFFVEQLLLYLRQNRYVEQTADGWQLQKVSGAEREWLPANIRTLLTARLDQLPQPVKEVVQTASVLGREFDLLVLRQMLRNDASLTEKLQHADHAAIWSAIEQTRYLFRHALLRDAAYEMQLRSRLRKLHQRASDAIQSCYRNELSPYWSTLAYHCDQAEMRSAALHWYELAGQRASEQFANHEALRAFSRALELCPEDEWEQRYRLLLGRETVLNVLGRREEQSADLQWLAKMVDEPRAHAKRSELALRQTSFALLTGHFDKALRAVEEAVAFAADANDGMAEVRARHRWGRALWESGDYKNARLHLNKALEQARAIGSAALEAQCLYDLGVVAYYEDRYAEVFPYLDEAAQLFASVNDRQGQCLCLSLYGMALDNSGLSEAAMHRLTSAVQLGRELGWRYSEARLLNQLGDNQMQLGRYESAQHALGESIRLALEINDEVTLASSLDMLGMVLLFSGVIEQAYQQLQQALSIQRRRQNQRGLGFVLTHLALVCARLQLWGEANRALDEALFIRRKANSTGLLLDSLAVAVCLALQQEEVEKARPYLNDLVELLEMQGVAGAEFPVQIYLFTAQGLLKLLDGNLQPHRPAIGILKQGHEFLNQRAQTIADDALRTNFLTLVPYNAQLLALWAQLQFEINSPSGE